MKRVVVTGGTRGIGLAVCRVFSHAGYAVTAFYSRGEEDAEKARKLLPEVSFVKADVSDETAVEQAFAALSRVDVLINNAGISLNRQVQDTTSEEWDRVFSVNAKGTFLCCRAAAKKMISEQSGAIVNISSVWGQTGGSCESAYSASKGAVIAFTKALAKELAPSHITVNCVAPGVIDTQMNDCYTAEEKAALSEEIPAGRFGSAEEVARAVLFLAENEYVTGQILGVNGGFFI